MDCDSLSCVNLNMHICSAQPTLYCCNIQGVFHMQKHLNIQFSHLQSEVTSSRCLLPHSVVWYSQPSVFEGSRKSISKEKKIPENSASHMGQRIKLSLTAFLEEMTTMASSHNDCFLHVEIVRIGEWLKEIYRSLSGRNSTVLISQLRFFFLERPATHQASDGRSTWRTASANNHNPFQSHNTLLKYLDDS